MINASAVETRVGGLLCPDRDPRPEAPSDEFLGNFVYDTNADPEEELKRFEKFVRGTPKPFVDTVCRKAISLIENDRQADYGTPEENFGRWAAMCAPMRLNPAIPGDLAVIMALGKVARMANRLKEDNFDDGAAYLSVARGLYGDAVEP